MTEEMPLACAAHRVGEGFDLSGHPPLSQFPCVREAIELLLT